MYRQSDLAFINIWRSAEKLHFIQPYWREEEKHREKKREMMMMKGQIGRERIKKIYKKKGRQKEEVGKKTKTKEQLEKGMQAWLLV